ncbi:hypothetical protein [Capybara microvirus Cap1_SP_45]|nr:hypothetical protein [Capybara microvirus Cap1_SP_45]
MNRHKTIFNGINSYSCDPHFTDSSPQLPEYVLNPNGDAILKLPSPPSLGKASDYSLNSLLKAGIDPRSMSAPSTPLSRLEGYKDLSKFADSLDSLNNNNNE